MKLIKSIWFLSFFALFINLGIVFLLIQNVILETKKAKLNLVKNESNVKNNFFWSYRTSEIDILADNLYNEKLKLKSREEQIQAMESRVNAEISELNRLKSEIENMRKQLTDKLIIIDDEESKNLKYIVATYSKLKTDSLMNVLGQMDEKMAIKIMSMMKPEQVSAVFEKMLEMDDMKRTQSKKIAELSEMIRLKVNMPKK